MWAMATSNNSLNFAHKEGTGVKLLKSKSYSKKTVHATVRVLLLQGNELTSYSIYTYMFKLRHLYIQPIMSPLIPLENNNKFWKERAWWEGEEKAHKTIPSCICCITLHFSFLELSYFPWVIHLISFTSFCSICTYCAMYISLSFTLFPSCFSKIG